MSKKKSIAVAIVLLLVLLIGGMLAYFTDTDTATNVFVLGDDIDISLSENSSWTNGGSGNTYNSVAANGIHPGAVVAKDPTVNNVSTTTPAYVFAEVIVPTYSTGSGSAPLFKLNSDTTSSPTALGTSVGDAGNTGWTLIKVDNTTSGVIKYVYAYGTSSAMTSLAAGASTNPVFTCVTLEPTLTAAQKATATNQNIVVNAYGIQTDSLGVTAPLEIFALFGN